MMKDGNDSTVMDDGGGEQECLPRRQCFAAFGGGWEFKGG
jgi:hypothetical protein